MQFLKDVVICLLISVYKPIAELNILLLMYLASGGEVPLSPADEWENRDREMEIKFTKEACGKARTLDSVSPDQHINHKINVFFFPILSLCARLE